MTDTRIVVVGARGAGKQTLLDGLSASTGGTRISDAQARIVLPGGDVLQLDCIDQPHAADDMTGAGGVLALVDATAQDAQAQLQACVALLAGPASALPAVLGISRVDLHPDWNTAATAAALAQAGHTLPVVPFDAHDPAQGLMLLDVLVSQIETDSLLPRTR